MDATLRHNKCRAHPLLSRGAAGEEKQSTPVGRSLDIWQLRESGEEIMAIIFISPTRWLSPPCGSFQDRPSARAERDDASSISLSAWGYKHKPDMNC